MSETCPYCGVKNPDSRWTSHAPGCDDLRRGLGRGRDEVTDEILNEVGQRARREVHSALRKGAKAKRFNRRNKRRRRK